MTDALTTIQDYIQTKQIRLQAVKVPMRTDQFANEFARNATHWHCTLTREGYGSRGIMWTPMAFYYSMGSAHTKPPTAADVLDSLAMDATTDTFEDWADNIGYDKDSRKAYATWEACRRTHVQLSELLGYDDTGLSFLIERVERL